MRGVIGRISSPRFVGRGEELNALEAAVTTTAQGEGSVVLVAGEAGIGKSRLISELTIRAEARGACVLMGECPPLGDGELAYAPIVGALRALVRQRGTAGLEQLSSRARHELGLLLPELALESDGVPARAASEGSQAVLFEQLLEVFLTAAREAPLVLVVEDLHWADQSTREFLNFLVRAARPERLVLVGTYRSDEVHGRQHPVRPFVHELGRSGQAARIELTPFTRAELREQIAAILGATPEPALVDRVLERSEGNPFFTEELLASSRPGTVLPDTLRDALLWRLEGKPASVQDVLRIAAVAGRTIDHGLLASVAGLPEDELTLALRDAVDSYVLAHDPSSRGYSFRHALLREAIYADLLPGQRSRLHIVLAEALSGQPELAGYGATAAAELAYHWYAAGDIPKALAASLAAGLAAEDIHAFGEALMHYERALGAWDAAADMVRELPLDRSEVTRRAAEAAHLTGTHVRAIALAQELIGRIDEDADPVRAAVAHARLGRILWMAGSGEQEALHEYERAVELMPQEPPSSDLAFVLASEAQMLLLNGRRAESMILGEQALQIATAVDSAAVQAHVLNTSCANLCAIGEFDRAVSAADDARAIAVRLGLVEEIGRSYVNGSDALDHSGRVGEAIVLAREGIEASRSLGIERRFGDCLRGEVAARLLHTGRWDEAEELVARVFDRGPTGLSELISLQVLGELQAERGALDAASRTLIRGDELVRNAASSAWHGPITEGKALVELWRGRPESAAALIAQGLAYPTSREHVFYTARLYELGARACAEIAGRLPGDGDLRREQTAVADALIERLDGLISRLTGSIPPRLLASRASCAAERSRIDDAGDPALWDDARRLWEACEDSYLAAYSRWRLADALLTVGGDRRQAETLLRDARQVAVRLEARPLCQELEALAKRARIELDVQDGSEPQSASMLREFELTAREIEVLMLVADGMTNREIAGELFISDKTASAHVSHILSKLSAPNRTAAAAMARRVGLGKDG